MNYHLSVLEAQNLLVVAIGQAKALLPQEVTRHHWQVNAAGSPAAWASTEAWFLNHDAPDPFVCLLLTHLTLMSTALAALSSVTTPQTTTGSLKLATKRRLA